MGRQAGSVPLSSEPKCFVRTPMFVACAAAPAPEGSSGHLSPLHGQLKTPGCCPDEPALNLLPFSDSFKNIIKHKQVLQDQVENFFTFIPPAAASFHRTKRFTLTRLSIINLPHRTALHPITPARYRYVPSRWLVLF